jgi:N-acetylmuramoyl-L-alanine amidase
VRVVYPPAGATIAVRDSTFIFGSVGSGRASLSINGAPVTVEPNGSFLAWLPVPPATAPAYAIVAARGADTVRVNHRVVIPSVRPPLADTGRLVVDSTSVFPRTPREVQRGELVRVSVRAPATATVHVVPSTGPAIPLVNVSRATGRDGDDPLLWATDLRAEELARGATLSIARGADTVRLPLGQVSIADTMPRFAVIGVAPSVVPDTDRVVIGKPFPGGTYKWFLLPGTIVQVTGRIGDAVRVRLDSSLEIWLDSTEVRPLPAGTPAPRRVTANARVAAGAGYSDVVIPIGERPAYLMTQTDRTLELTLYGVQGNTDITSFVANDSLVRQVTWRQEGTDRAHYTLELAEAPFGYLVLWRNGAFVVRVRQRPAVDSRAPLKGLTIAVNAGHPPAGSTGPTGLYEAVPTLEISRRLARILEARGARVVMVRTTPDALALALRPVIARRGGAHAFVSIHLNALPDGINPYRAHGTGTYYFYPQSEPLARVVQSALVGRLGLPNLGVFYDNLSDIRQTWMPSVLCEGAFIIIPAQEAALRTPEFQERYAQGVADGLEAYFRTLK